MAGSLNTGSQGLYLWLLPTIHHLAGFCAGPLVRREITPLEIDSV